MRQLAALLPILILLCSCERDANLQEMTDDPTVRLSSQGITQFSYDPRSCQLGFCREKSEFRVLTDDMSDFFIVILDRIPSAAGTHVTGDITWTTASSLEHRPNVTLEVLKLEGDIVWLWSEADKISATLRILE